MLDLSRLVEWWGVNGLGLWLVRVLEWVFDETGRRCDVVVLRRVAGADGPQRCALLARCARSPRFAPRLHAGGVEARCAWSRC